MRTESSRDINTMRYESNETIFQWDADGVTMEIMQFIGLLDKNGKEIYEGDIVLVDGDKKTLVSWSDKFASFCIKNDTWMFLHWFGESVDPAECEIIGNIYENPELLECKLSDLSKVINEK